MALKEPNNALLPTPTPPTPSPNTKTRLVSADIRKPVARPIKKDFGFSALCPSLQNTGSLSARGSELLLSITSLQVLQTNAMPLIISPMLAAGWCKPSDLGARNSEGIGTKSTPHPSISHEQFVFLRFAIKRAPVDSQDLRRFHFIAARYPQHMSQVAALQLFH